MSIKKYSDYKMIDEVKIILKRYPEGLTEREIAKVMGCAKTK